MNPHKYAFKNYIFDFYGTLVDIETDESSPILWDTMAQIYQSYGASYTGEGLRLRYRELVQQAEEDLAKEKQVAYPEIDLMVIFVQLYLEGHPSGNSVVHLKEWGRLISRTFRVLSQRVGTFAITSMPKSDFPILIWLYPGRGYESCRLPNLSLIQCPSRFYQSGD